MLTMTFPSHHWTSRSVGASVLPSRTILEDDNDNKLRPHRRNNKMLKRTTTIINLSLLVTIVFCQCCFNVCRATHHDKTSIRNWSPSSRQSFSSNQQLTTEKELLEQSSMFHLRRETQRTHALSSSVSTDATSRVRNLDEDENENDQNIEDEEEVWDEEEEKEEGETDPVDEVQEEEENEDEPLTEEEGDEDDNHGEGDEDIDETSGEDTASPIESPPVLLSSEKEESPEDGEEMEEEPDNDEDSSSATTTTTTVMTESEVFEEEEKELEDLTETPTESPKEKNTEVPYVPSDEDPIKDQDELDAEQEKVQDLEEELHEEEVVARRAGGLGIFIGIVAMIFTAHQMSENPDGFFASVCRLAITICSVVVKIVCMPCRKLLGAGNPHYHGHMPISTNDYSYRNDPYRSSANAGFELS